MEVHIVKHVELTWYAANLQVKDECGAVVADCFLYDRQEWRRDDPSPFRYADVRRLGLWAFLSAMDDDPQAFPDNERVDHEAHWTADGDWCEGFFRPEYKEKIVLALGAAKAEAQGGEQEREERA